VKPGMRRRVRHLPLAAVLGYLLFLSFPQLLFAHQVSHRGVTVYAHQPLGREIEAVLDRAQARVAASALHDDAVRPSVFLTGGFRSYALWSLYLGGNSFAKSYPLLPTSNIFINRCDPARDAVFRASASHGERSLSGVIAHETAHLLIRRKLGLWRNLALPAWKKEGYAEYVAGGSTLPHEVGVRMWKANPSDATGYRYFKDYMLVSYLLDHDKVSVEELLHRDHDVRSLERRVLASLSRETP
jgi:hypothetical protein